MATAPPLQRLTTDVIDLKSGYAALMRELRSSLPPHPDVSVHYRDLAYSVSVPTVGYSIPSVGGECVGCVSGLARGLTCQSAPSVEFPVLHPADGVLRPGSMTLLLAPPGHGKSALLQGLAGRLPAEKVSGTVTYGGEEAGSASADVGRLVAYMSQTDEHLALLTVRETLQFALSNAVVDSPALLKDEGLAKSIARRVDTIAKLLGLEECMDTYVGSDLVRGVSGGQRKRVSIGEVLITNARVLLLDEFSTGLDTSTTFDITGSLRHWTREMGGVLAASLLQPPPEVYGLFDDLILMREGHVVYHGPRDQAATYFTQQGWVIPADVDEADWLVEMLTDPAAAWAKQAAVTPAESEAGEGKEEPVAPTATTAVAHTARLSTAGMVAWWKAHALYKELVAAAGGASASGVKPSGVRVADADSKQAVQEGTKAPESGWLTGYAPTALSLDSPFAVAQYGAGFAQTWGQHVSLSVGRQAKLLARNPMYIFGKLVDNCIMGLALGSLFWQLPLDGVQGRLGAVVFGLILSAFSNFAVIPAAIEARNVVQKQDRLSFYPMSAYVVSNMIMHLPVAAAESLALSCFIYWMPGFAAEADRFLFFYFLVFLTDCAFALVFLAISFAAPNMEAAQSMSAPIVSLFLLFAGLLNTRSSIPDFMIWAYWISPFSWSTRSAALNELLSSEYDTPVPGTDSNFGVVLLERFEIQTEEEWLWAGPAFSVLFYVLMMAATIASIKYVRFDVAIGTSRSSPGETEQAVGSSEVRPVPPATLAFKDLGYTVTLEDGTDRALLTSVTGIIRPGSCTALCGVSGAGKSTLLDVLAGRKTAGVQTGEVRVNGKVQDKCTFARITAYVEQESLLMEQATVVESVEFAASLRLDPAVVSDGARADIVQEVMHLMELMPIAGRIVGTTGTQNALSPSQRKLLSIAIELVAQPSILFLDEPTSGLDSRAAANVMRVVRNIANTGRTVICTIHQPSKEVFLTSFDAMLLLQRGGHCVFFGDLGEGAVALTDYLGTFPGVQPMAEGDNPATWMLDVLDGGTGTLTHDEGSVDEEAQEAEVQVETDFGAAYKDSQLCSQSIAVVDAAMQASGGEDIVVPTDEFAVGVWTQFVAVLGRMWLGYWRNVELNYTRLLILAILGVFFGLSYLDVPSDTVGGVTSTISLVYIATAFAGLMNQGVMLPVLSQQRAVFYRERSANMYIPEVYSISVLLCEIPYLALFSTVMATVYYWMAGLRDDADVFFAYLLMHWLVSVSMSCLGMAFASAIDGIESAQTNASLITTLWLLLSGTFAPWPTVPEGWAWFRWVNPVAYAVNSMGSFQFFCDTPPVTDGSGVVVEHKCPTLELVTEAGPVTLPVWDFMRDTYDLRYDDRWTDMGLVVAIGAFFFLVFVLATRFISHIKR